MIWAAFFMLFLLIIVWSTVWKGIALWKSAKNDQLGWFVILLVVNTAGILEIVYLAFFQRKKEQFRQGTVIFEKPTARLRTTARRKPRRRRIKR